ncbi:hypothetical protein PDENDC454_24273 [Paenibacillus dendritiformis C454]|uniref:Uncharacterized protein n=1 Tax=Paenibacillus dendritiformis C454 TaxID=1131935 RepID=H3SMR1_9BACL|nr:hypothetical protein PDENDC454_24273 [Paenibacillus dendritiformis C454]
MNDFARMIAPKNTQYWKDRVTGGLGRMGRQNRIGTARGDWKGGAPEQDKDNLRGFEGQVDRTGMKG